MAVSAAFAVRILRYRTLLVWAVSVFALDQISKAVIAATLPFETYFAPGRITIIPGFFHLVHMGNTGAAWSLFTGRSDWLALLAIATLGAIYLFRHQLELSRRPVQVVFGLLCGGIVGNLVDRLIHHHVVDFLLFTFGRYDFPAFNLADSAICIGVGLYILNTIIEPDGAPRN